jgi:hypothetical protein
MPMSARKHYLPLFALLFFSFTAFAQQPSCNVFSNANTVATEGLAELMAPIGFSCSGSTAGSTVTTDIFVTLNTKVTNRVGSGGQPQNISVTVDNGSGPVNLPVTSEFSGNNTIIVNQVKYVVPSPASQAVTIQISGIRGDVASITGGTAAGLVTAQIVNTGLTITNFSAPVTVGVTLGPSLLATVQNNGFPCSGSAVPAGSFGFPDLISADTAFSTVRVTEGTAAAFAPKVQGADTGNRVLVNLSGYPAGVTVFVPTAIVGNDGTKPTSGGTLEEAASGGIYSPGVGQLLLNLVTGADANGAGGSVVGPPGSIQDLSSMSQIALSSGSGYAVYEVVDSSPQLIESVQIPIFEASPASVCTSSGLAQIAVYYAPVSTVSIATATDPIPRFVQETPGQDCAVFNDCSSVSVPRVSVSQTSLALTGNSQGNPQVASFNVSNAGQGQLLFTLSVTYQTGSGWLSVRPNVACSRHLSGNRHRQRRRCRDRQHTIDVQRGTDRSHNPRDRECGLISGGRCDCAELVCRPIRR